MTIQTNLTIDIARFLTKGDYYEVNSGVPDSESSVWGVAERMKWFEVGCYAVDLYIVNNQQKAN